jgi:hypothetical protein
MHSSSPACVLYLLPIDLTFGEDWIASHLIQ